MLDPTLRALFIALIIIVLRIVFHLIGVPVSDEILGTLALVIFGWIFGNEAAQRAELAFYNARSRARK